MVLRAYYSKYPEKCARWQEVFEPDFDRIRVKCDNWMYFGEYVRYNGYAKYHALCFCINSIQTLLTRPHDAELDFYLYQYLDKFVPLAYYGVIADDAWDDFKHIHPNAVEVAHQGMLPNVVSRLYRCSFWIKGREKGDALIQMLAKTLPHRCRGRSFKKRLLFLCNREIGFTSMIFWIVYCSMLGNYQQARVRPDFKTRLELYELFGRTDFHMFREWMTQHKIIIIYALREFLIYALRFDTALNETVRATYMFDQFEDHVYECNDNSWRKEYNRTRSFEQIKRDLKFASGQLAKSAYRLQSVSYIQMMIGILGNVDMLRKARSTPLPREKSHHMWELISRLDASQYPPVDLLLYYGVPEEDIHTLINSQEMFKAIHTKGQIEVGLKKLSPFAINAALEFFKFSAQMVDIRIFPLEASWIPKQIRALLRMFRVEHISELPNNTGLTYLCRSCCEIRSWVDGKNSRKSKKRSVEDVTYGFAGVTVDMTNNHAYCAECLKKAKKKPNADRRLMRLIPIPMIGNMLILNSQRIVMCPRCAGFAEFSMERYVNDEFICALCRQNPKLEGPICCTYCNMYFRSDSKITSFKCIDNVQFDLCSSCHRGWFLTACKTKPSQYIWENWRNKEMFRYWALERKN
eukprot:TRINITY_DN1582_c0_g1_i1.p1 TRINITY_DN1582_c0_g1~~TRINITY_DN1582_c0_g1_i1.p1  ORF type:complete len:634 (+),score=62.39 TRINITY_DN1582_c0_g1_i1:2592-4493(+)